MGSMTDTSTTERFVQQLGRTDEERNGRRGYVVVEVEIRTRDEDRETVDHTRTWGPVVELSFQASQYAPYDRKDNPSRCGQATESLAEVTEPAPGWTLDEISELRSLWERWHLNTMRAACAHMDPATLAREDDGFGGSRISTSDPRNVCETGYRYGHAWLIELVPDEVVARVRYLMRDRSDALYQARGYDAHGKPVTD